MRYRLNRLDEVYPGYSLFFITFCTEKRQNLLAHPAIHESFINFAITAKEHHILVGRHVIMPDHLHFFVDLADEKRLPIWIKSLKNSLSKTLRLMGHPSPHWQKGFFDHMARSEQSYEEKWIYVQQNPVRKGLVAEAQTWPYQGEVEPLPFH